MSDPGAKVEGDPRDRHFAIDPSNKELGTRSVKGGLAVFLGQGVRLVLQIGSIMILARLLTPADFGLVAMVTAVTGFLEHFKDMGLTMATVQRARVTHAQATNLFWVNVAISLALTALCISLAPLIATFYREPALVPIAVAMSLSFFFGGVPAQHLALLRRQMQFTRLALIEVVGLAAGVTVALLLAWKGAGYWALVGLAITDTVIKGVLTAGSSGWWPGLPRRNVGTRSMLKFGLNVSGFNLLTYIARSADNILIGRYLGASATGVYTKAYGLLMLPLIQVNSPMNSVAMPVLSRLQGDPPRYRRFYFQALSIIAYVTGPLIVLLAATADNLILLVLGPQWDQAADVFRILAFAAIFQPLLYTAGWVWLSLGRTKELLHWSMVNAPVCVASFAIGLPWGLEGVALAYAIGVNLLTPVGMAWAYKGTELRLIDALAAVRRPYALSALLFVVAMLVQSLLSETTTLFNLVVTTASSGTIALAIAWIYPPTRKDLQNLAALIGRLRRPKNETAGAPDVDEL